MHSRDFWEKKIQEEDSNQEINTPTNQHSILDIIQNLQNDLVFDGWEKFKKKKNRRDYLIEKMIEFVGCLKLEKIYIAVCLKTT